MDHSPLSKVQDGVLQSIWLEDSSNGVKASLYYRTPRWSSGPGKTERKSRSRIIISASSIRETTAYGRLSSYASTSGVNLTIRFAAVAEPSLIEGDNEAKATTDSDPDSGPLPPPNLA